MESMDLINYILFTVFLLFLIPFYTQIRMYLITKSNSYLIFSLIFILAIIDSLLRLPSDRTLFIDFSITFVYITIFWIILMMADELRNNSNPQLSIFWKLLAVFTLSISWVLKYFVIIEDFSIEYTYLRITIGEFYRFIVGIIIIFSVNRAVIFVEAKRINDSLRLWKIAGYVIMINGIIRLLAFGYLSILSVYGVSIDSIIILNLNYFSDFMAVLLLLIVLIIAILYPEAMLISELQFHKIHELYSLLEKDQSKYILTSYQDEKLMNYLHSVAEIIKLKNSN
jgi:hypothetical protein